MTPELPYETGGGGRGLEFSLCRRLVERGHQVLNLSPVLAGEAEHAQALRNVGVENWTVARPRSHVREALSAVGAEPRVLATAVRAPVRALEMRVFWVALRQTALRAVAEWRPDIVVVGHDMAAAWACELPPSLPAVLTLHNLTWHWYLSRAQLRGGLAALPLRAEAVRYRRYLLRVLPRFDAAVVFSTIEAAELRRLSRVPASVIPAGLDTEALTPAPEPPGPPRVIFTGTLSYPPNGQGIIWFTEHVWPQVLRQLPDAQLDIVGRSPPPSVLGLGARPGVNVVGPVANMAPYFARAHAVVVPILTGAGIRVKIVEAMAAGRAIVSTSRGWEGLPHVEPDEHLLVADRPEDFAAATVRVLTDPAARNLLAVKARTLVEQHYTWRRLGDEVETVLERVLATSQTPSQPARTADDERELA